MLSLSLNPSYEEGGELCNLGQGVKLANQLYGFFYSLFEITREANALNLSSSVYHP
jgi:hypothetical protein